MSPTSRPRLLPRVRRPLQAPSLSRPRAAGFVQANQCNNVFGCLEEQQFERCTCYRDCGYDGEPVCGSDGQIYQNLCQMEVFACRNGTRIKQVPPSQCPRGKSSANQRREGGVLKTRGGGNCEERLKKAV